MFIKQILTSSLIGLVVLGVHTPVALAEAAGDGAQAVADLSFREIRRSKENMTDIQWEEFSESLKGKRVRWNGYVEDVSKKMFGGYEVLVDMDPPSEQLSVQDVNFSIPKEQAASLKKDSPISFEGVISSVMSILGSIQVSLKDAKVL